MRNSSPVGNIGDNLKKISSLKCEPESFWEGIIKELIIEERVIFVFLLWLRVFSINWIYRQLTIELLPCVKYYSNSW